MTMVREIILAVGGVGLGLTALFVARPLHAEDAGGPRTITLPQMEPRLPDLPGRDAVTTGCVLCHSARYITMQPAFSREVWVAEVDKMRKVFGAPVTDDQAKVIVDYLVAIRGTKGTAGKP
jgi:hypothetical protein